MNTSQLKALGLIFFIALLLVGQGLVLEAKHSEVVNDLYTQLEYTRAQATWLLQTCK